MAFDDMAVYEVWVGESRRDSFMVFGNYRQANEYACRLAVRNCGTVYMEAIHNDSTTRYVYAAYGRRVVAVSRV